MFDFEQAAEANTRLSTPPQTTDAAELVSVSNAARALGIDRRTLISHLRAAGVPVLVFGRNYRVSWLELAAWVNRNAEAIARAKRQGKARAASRRANAAEAAERLNSLTTSETVGGVK